MRIARRVVSLFVLLCFTTVAAQATACGAEVQQAMSAVQQDCAATGRNQACYGYVSLQATPRDGVQNFSFAKQGDIVNVADLQSLQLTPFDPAKNTWGIALMRLQANLPDTLPGENVTLLLFGDVQFQNAPSSGAPSLQAFYFRTGIEQPACESAPTSGLLIQTPQGAGQVELRADNVDIQLGSTAYLEAQAGKTMDFYVVEGKSQLRANGKTVVVPAGAKADIPVDDNLDASGEPSDPQAYDPAEVEDLPVSDLPDEITIADPADEQTVEEADQEGALISTEEAGASESELESTEQPGEAEQLQATDQSSEPEQIEATDQSSESQPGDDQPAEAPTPDNGDSSDTGNS